MLPVPLTGTVRVLVGVPTRDTVTVEAPFGVTLEVPLHP